MRRETVSSIRFGYGLAQGSAQSADPGTLIKNAQRSARAKPRLPLQKRASLIAERREMRKSGSEAEKKAAQRALQRAALDDIRFYLSQAVTDPGFGARLVAFWSDHFTVAARGPVLRVLVPDFVDGAIRPHIASRFSDMLKAVALHPAMLIYLNQVQSVGPSSRAGKRRGMGLNENLAREIFELHTLGVDSAYTQADVRKFAELLTGLSVTPQGFKFRPQMSEPGPHKVLGKLYGGNLDTILGALEDIARHPDTARHIAGKLVEHFLGEADPSLIDQVARAFLDTDGDLPATYRALLEDDCAWQAPFRKAKLPFDFIVSALRAAGAKKADISGISRKDFRTGIVGSLQLMGQPLFQPPGPDGWKEEAEAWITPPGLAARIRWSVAFAERIESGHDPRAFLSTALDDAASPLLSRAVAGSESRVEGIALTLVSPEFNRR